MSQSHENIFEEIDSNQNNKGKDPQNLDQFAIQTLN